MAQAIADRPALDLVEERAPKEFLCRVCDKEYRSKYSAKRHVEAIHQQLEKIRCYKSSCTKKFTNHSTALRHAIRDHGEHVVRCPDKSCSVSSVDFLRLVYYQKNRYNFMSLQAILLH